MQNYFSKQLLNWFQTNGRKNLPWQQNPTPYRVWVSEIMLQQTQVKTVIDYYQKFIQRFPNIEVLANCEEDEMLRYWSGLGYYARARNLHKTAKIISSDYAGKFPQTQKQLELLPGIGRSTAGAILSLAMGQYAAILDGNCKRVYSRYAAIQGINSSSETMKKLWDVAIKETPKQQSGLFNQAMMDLGSMICTRTKSKCLEDARLCPLSLHCIAYQNQTINDYPQKKKNKVLPVKNAIFIIIKDKQQQILLQKRPATGIWSSLWSFPQYDNEVQVEQWLLNSANKYQLYKKGTSKTHQFSHFKMHYTEHYYSLEKMGVLAEGAEKNWFSIDQALQLALPAPIKKILNNIVSQ